MKDTSLMTAFPPIEDLIPHRGTMKLVDEIHAFDRDGEGIHCLTVVRPNWPLCDEGEVRAVICVELTAQAAACFNGLSRVKDSSIPRSGFLVGIKNAVYHTSRIPEGKTLEIKVKHLYGNKEYGVYAGWVYSGDSLIGETEIQVMTTETAVIEEGPGS